jgi:peptidoglycan/LPS O-acetylase OafA/YrhL
MGNTQQPQPLGSGTTGADAAAELAEIQRRQERVIQTQLVPVWYWWVIAAGMVAIGAARDSHDPVVLGITIPLAVLAIAGLIASTRPRVRRRVRVRDAAQPGGPGVAALVGLIVLVNVVTIAAAVSLVGHVPHPLTISYGAGGAVLVIAGPPLNRYLNRLMLSNARQHLADSPELRSRPWRGLLSSDPGEHSPGHAGSTKGGGTS